ncbi:MAG: hypothetical protein QW520_01890 [Methanomassiliicoccales archaeon]
MASGVNVTTKAVCGLTTSFSTYAVIANSTRVSINGPNHAYPNGMMEMTYFISTPIPQYVMGYRASWSKESDDGALYERRDDGSGLYSTLVVQYVNNLPVAGSRVYFLPYQEPISECWQEWLWSCLSHSIWTYSTGHIIYSAMPRPMWR